MRFCNGIPDDRDRIVADEHRWPAGDASPLRDGRGVQRLPSRCCGARLARPHLPPSPLPLPHGERKGGRLVRLTGRAILGSLPLLHGERKGERGSWCERMVARARNGRIGTVRASCNSRVFDQALTIPSTRRGRETYSGWRERTLVIPHAMVV